MDSVGEEAFQEAVLVEAGELKKLEELFGNNFISLIEFGLHSTKDTRSLLLILTEISVEDLVHIKKTSFVKKPKYFVMTQKEFVDSQDVFPLFFLDVLEQPKTLFGADITKKIKIDKKTLRHELERSVRSTLLSFRHGFLDAKFFDKKALLDSFLVQLEPLLVVLLYLKKEHALGLKEALIKVEEIYNINNSISESIYGSTHSLDHKLAVVHEFLEELSDKLN